MASGDLSFSLALCPSRNIPFASATCREGGNNVQRLASRHAVEWKLCHAILPSLLLRKRHRTARPRLALRIAVFVFGSRDYFHEDAESRRAHARLVVTRLSTCARAKESPLLFQALSLSSSLPRSLISRACVCLTHAGTHSVQANGEAFFCRSLHLAFPQSTAKRHREWTTRLRCFGARRSFDVLRFTYLVTRTTKARSFELAETASDSRCRERAAWIFY